MFKYIDTTTLAYIYRATRQNDKKLISWKTFTDTLLGLWKHHYKWMHDPDQNTTKRIMFLILTKMTWKWPLPHDEL